MDLTINGPARDEIARILEQVAKEGLDYPRNLDNAIDAIGAALQGDPMQKVTDIGSGEVYWIGDDDNAEDSFGFNVIVNKGYFVAVPE